MAKVRAFLKQINAFPFPVSVKHYFVFGETLNSLKDKKLDSRESWEVLRESHPDFSIAETREEWLRASELEVRKDGQDNGLKKRAEDVVRVLDSKNISSIFSIGSGGAGLEYQIKKLKPELELTCSEQSQKNVDLLQRVFLECDNFTTFDITTKNWPKELQNKNSLALIYRIDASFTDKEWRNIFENIYAGGVENILYIPTNFLTVLSFFIRLKRRMGWILKKTPYAFAGYLRTKKTFQGYWGGLYKEEFLDLGGLGGFWLTKK